MDESRNDPGSTAEPGNSAALPGPATAAEQPLDLTPSILGPINGIGSVFARIDESTDEKPTVISSHPILPLRAEEALAGVLRGRRLAHFELLEPIGVGGMAAVIRACDLQLDRQVALKILPPDMSGDAEIVRRFHQEARSAARLDHENIARVFFCGEDQGLHFIAFEFVEGQNLRSILERRGCLPVAEAVHYALQIATGLAHAAERGVVHRDVKPSNIIIMPNGRAKLVDMGLARSLHVDHGLTHSGVTLGTLDYISPEQALEPRDADVRSDIYSLGCTIYHMLTGKPPVPEGTPARKLHHHQHIAPVDPRQINPQVPDEVAAVLARMMTKDRLGRYQRPEELVQHLILLAQKVGAGTDLPAPSLFVDAALPSPPQLRPSLLAVAGAVLLLVLVLVLEPALWQPPPPLNLPRADADKGRQAAVKGGAGVGEQNGNGGVGTAQHRAGANETEQPGVVLTPQPSATTRTVETARELAQALEQSSITTVLVNRDLDLNELIAQASDRDAAQPPRLQIQGRDLTIAAAPGLTRLAALRLKYNPAVGRASPWAALTVRGGKVTLRRLQLEIDAAEADVVMTGLAQLGGQVILEDCEFVQAPVTDERRTEVSSISVQALPDGRKPTLMLRRCHFATGVDAIEVKGPADIEPTDCSFGPHARALFRVERQGTLNLTNVSVVMQTGAVVRLESLASCHLDVSGCIISRPDGAVGQVALIEQAGEVAGDFQYVGANNYYHNLTAFVLFSGTPENAVTRHSTFRQRLGVQDKRSFAAAQSPWVATNPLQLLKNKQPADAFQVNQQLRDVRQSDGRLLGVQRCVWGLPYVGELTPLEERRPAEAVALANKVKVFDPKVEESGSGVYRTLQEAIEAARPGDTIAIRHSGLLRLDMIRLERSGIDLTIRADKDYRPILTLGRTTEPDAALFRVHDGALRLEQLEFSMPAGRSEYRSLAVAAVVGDGRCGMKDCIVTLDESREVPASVFHLPDASQVMRMDGGGRAGKPAFQMERCFVRGAGDLIAVRSSRAFELQVEDSLLALQGSMLVMDGSNREVANRGSIDVTLRQITSYLEDHLLLLKANREEARGRSLALTQVDARNCLFAAGHGKSLVHLDGVENDEQMRRCFTWHGQNNFYSNFDRLLDQQPSGEGMAPIPYDKARWAALTDESTGRFDRIRFAVSPVDNILVKALPADFKVRADHDLQDCGVAIERLPRPADSRREESRPMSGAESSD